MKLVSRQLSLTHKERQPINFSLYLNKMLLFHDNFTYRDVERRHGQERERGIKETFKPCEGELNGKRFREEQYGPFRQHNPVYCKSTSLSAEILKQRQLQQAACCRAMEAAGWRSFVIHARLTSPFVSGLGMAHPTETGLVLDHTSGMPYIPASSQKGVLRLAYLINTLRDDQGNWLPEDTLARDRIIERGKDGQWQWLEDAASRTLFGSGGDKDAIAGQVVVLDAYPLTPPELGEEILNPHYGEYYQGVRGPTEDQSPIPIKFLVVKAGAEFVFRLLLRTPFANAKSTPQNGLVHLVEKTLRGAITEEGMGAKTAVGFGRFTILAQQDPPLIGTWQKEIDEGQKPWLKVVSLIDGIDNNWGQFKHALQENAQVKEYQSIKEVAIAVREAALRIKKAFPKKWDEKRDIIMADFLRPAGLDWKIAQGPNPQAGKTPGAGTSTPCPEEQAAVERIKAIDGFSGDLMQKIEAELLPLSALLRLRERMKNEWDCDGRNVKPAKKKAWKQVKSLINQKKI
jgi:CRISPR type III-B/RAMP module RAMP protein Cmr6